MDDKGKFVAADAKITGPDTVEVTSAKVKKIAMVYYAWAMNPVGVNLINKEGLPASPFRWGKMPPALAKAARASAVAPHKPGFDAN